MRVKKGGGGGGGGGGSEIVVAAAAAAAAAAAQTLAADVRLDGTLSVPLISNCMFAFLYLTVIEPQGNHNCTW